MTPDDVRAQFSDAYEQDLDPAQKAAFDAALRADPELTAEYQDFCQLLSGAPDALGPELPVPDLLRGVQGRIRRGTRGRYYADRFADRAGRGGIHPLALALMLLLLLLGLWLAASYLRLLPAAHTTGQAYPPALVIPTSQSSHSLQG